jgi:electron transfer flavoprotein alpha/beta subunit
MEFLVCVKQVPDTEELKVDIVTGKIKDGVPNIVNPYDKNALEAAVKLKEAHGGSVTVISMGSEKAKAALKECISTGADKAVLISDPVFEGSDSYSTSLLLAAAIKKLGSFDLILCGNQATDTDSGQVGPLIAENLGMAQVTYVQKIEVKENTLVVNREADEGFEIVEVQLPAVCTVLDSINEPRLATIKTKMAANKAKIEVLTAADLEINPAKVGNGSPTKVQKTFAPPKREAGIKIQEKSGSESALKLFENLVAAKLV